MILYYTAALALGIRTAHALRARTREGQRWLARPRLAILILKIPLQMRSPVHNLYACDLVRPGTLFTKSKQKYQLDFQLLRKCKNLRIYKRSTLARVVGQRSDA